MIKLSEIRDALYDVSMGTSCYFNTKTNEILWYWDFNKEESTYTEEDEFNDDIISMFNFYSKNDYDIISSEKLIYVYNEIRGHITKYK